MTPAPRPAIARRASRTPPLTLFDLFVLAVMALSVLFGAARGLTREAITLVALFGGVVMVGLLSGPLSGLFGDGLVAAALVLGGLFAAGFLAVHAGLEVIARRLIGADPKRPDRLLGGAFGLVRGWFLVGLTFLAMTYYFEAAALPDFLGKAWTRGFAASGARVLDGIGIEGTGDADSESRQEGS